MATSAEACSEIVRAFDGQGWHRTATDVDHQSGEWLLETLKASGLDSRAVAFPFSRVDASACSVSSGTFHVEGVHLSDSGLPPANTTIRGTFAPESIYLVRTESHGLASELDGIRRGNVRAVVIAVAGHPGGITLLNAWSYDHPGGVPIVQVPASAWDELAAARESSAPVEVHCGGIRTETSAFNVFATIPGRRPELPPIVVLTPRSGWWQCAGERGGGLATWVEVARAAVDAGFERDLVFLATTGHELGFLGIKRYFDFDPELPTRALAWIHLGANIGAAGARLLIRASDSELLSIARDLAPAFRTVSPPPVFSTSERPVGEAGEVLIRGGRFVSLVGADAPLFHSTLDRWPGAIDSTAIAAAADGVLQIIEELDRQT